MKKKNNKNWRALAVVFDKLRYTSNYLCTHLITIQFHIFNDITYVLNSNQLDGTCKWPQGHQYRALCGFFPLFLIQVNMNNFSDRIITFHNSTEHQDKKTKQKTKNIKIKNNDM